MAPRMHLQQISDVGHGFACVGGSRRTEHAELPPSGIHLCTCTRNLRTSARHAPSTPSGQRVEGPPQITEIPCHHGWVSMSSTQTGIGVAPVPRHKSVTCGLADHAPDEFHLVCGSLSSSVNMFSSMVHSSKSASLLRLSSSVQRARALQIVAQLP